MAVRYFSHQLILMGCIKVRNQCCNSLRSLIDSCEIASRVNIRLGLVLLGSAFLYACGQDGCNVKMAEESGYQAAIADQLMTAHPNYDGLSCEAAKQAWVKGWQHGVKALCVPQKGWEMASQGMDGYQVCAAEVNQPGSYLASFRLSEQIRDLEVEAEVLEGKSLAEGLSPQEQSRLRNIGYELNELKVIAEQWGLINSFADQGDADAMQSDVNSQSDQ